MSDAAAASQAAGSQGDNFLIPDSVRQTFGDLITLIKESESMNDEDRQYWFEMLPVMSSEQVANLRSILTNEKTQLAAIDAKYAAQANAGEKNQELEEKRRTTREQLKSQEQQDQHVERTHEENILKEIEGA